MKTFLLVPLFVLATACAVEPDSPDSESGSLDDAPSDGRSSETDVSGAEANQEDPKMSTGLKRLGFQRGY